MHRRTFLRGGLQAALAGPLAADALLAQETPAGRGAVPASAPPPTTARALVLDVSSTSLQWLRGPDEVAKAAIEMTCPGVSLTVGPYPAHVDSAKIASELPAFATRIRTHGVRVAQVKSRAIDQVSDAELDTLIGAAAQAGLTHYSLGGQSYDLKKPLDPQIAALKRRLETIVRRNERRGVKLLYDVSGAPDAVGAVVLDLVAVLRAFDPRFVGLYWDSGNMALHGNGMWETLLRLSGPYVGAVGFRDRGWVQDLGLLGEGGPFTGPSPRVEPLVTQPDGSAIPGTPGAAAGRGGGRGGGRGAGGARGGGAPAQPASADDGPAPAGRGAGGRGGAGGPANSAGAGSIDANNPLYRSLDGEMPKRPIGGKNAKGAGWSAPSVAMGTGIVHLPRLAAVLADIGFNGPSELRSDYPGIGGAESGADRITMPRQYVLGMLKRDVITIRKSFEMADSGLSI